MNKITSKFQAIVGRAKGRNSTAPNINPPLYAHGRTYRLLRLLSAVSFMLLLLLSIPALVLQAYGYNFIEINAEMGFYLVDDEAKNDFAGSLVAALPHNLFRIPEKLVLVVAMLNILLSMAGLSFVAWDWRAGRRTQARAYRRNAVILHVINAVLVLSALIATSVAHKNSSTFRYQSLPKEPNAVSPSGYRYYRYDSGTFDLETWTCELKNAPRVGDARKDYSAQCQIEAAGRIILVPFFLATIAVAGLSVWALIVGGQQAPHKEQSFNKDIDLEASSNGPEDGKQVQVQEVELGTLSPERQVDARLSKIEEDAEEHEEITKDAISPAESKAVVTGPTDSKDADTKAGANEA